MKQSLKTFLLVMTLLILPGAGAFAASPDDIFYEYKSLENAEYIKVPRFLLSTAGKLHKVPSIANKVTGLRVLDLTACSEQLHDEFKKRFAALTPDFETLVTVKDYGDYVRIITKPEGNKFKDIYIFTVDENDICLVKIGGVFTKEDIEAFVNDKKKKTD